jgi:hypothetical protein
VHALSSSTGTHGPAPPLPVLVEVVLMVVVVLVVVVAPPPPLPPALEDDAAVVADVEVDEDVAVSSPQAEARKTKDARVRDGRRMASISFGGARRSCNGNGTALVSVASPRRGGSRS